MRIDLLAIMLGVALGAAGLAAYEGDIFNAVVYGLLTLTTTKIMHMRQQARDAHAAHQAALEAEASPESLLKAMKKAAEDERNRKK